MNKINNISFTGLGNIGTCSVAKPLDEERIVGDHCIITQLYDDFNGKDLTEFKSVIKKCNSKHWYENLSEDNRLLHIMTKTVQNFTNEFDQPVPELYINYEKVPVNEETIPLFTYIAKITKRIANMEPEEFKCAEDFKYGPAGRFCLIPGYDMKQVASTLRQDFHEFVDNVLFNNKMTKLIAEEINKNISKQMMNYFI